MVINSRERAEQDISRVKSCPPATGRAASACEDNLKGKWGQEIIFLPKATEEPWKNWGEISAGLERINPLRLCREGNGHLTSSDKASDFAAYLKPSCAQPWGHPLQQARCHHTPGHKQNAGDEQGQNDHFAGASPSGLGPAGWTHSIYLGPVTSFPLRAQEVAAPLHRQLLLLTALAVVQDVVVGVHTHGSPPPRAPTTALGALGTRDTESILSATLLRVESPFIYFILLADRTVKRLQKISRRTSCILSNKLLF